jgi:hypothetical protein
LSGVKYEELAAMAIIMAKVSGFNPKCRAVWIATSKFLAAAAWKSSL